MKRYVILILLILFFAQPGQSYGGEIAVIVNKDNALDDVSYNELVKIFKTEKKFWDDGSSIYLIVQGSRSAEKEVILKTVYKMNDQELKQFWLAKIFQGTISSFPKVIVSNQSVKAFVRQVPNAIGYIDAAETDDSVKVLKINGKLPGESGYQLADG